MTSLRGRLLLALWLTLLGVGGVSAAIAYAAASVSAQELLDDQLRQLALLAAQPEESQTLLSAHPDHDPEDDLIVAAWAPDGRISYTSDRNVSLPRLTESGFHDVGVAATAYRIFAGPSGGRWIEVAQQLETRREAAGTAALAAALPVLFLVPILGLLTGAVIRATLRPLGAAATVVASRDELSPDPLPVAGLPDELRPFADEINRLLLREAAALRREREFIANAAHGLRTPLAALQLQVDLLTDVDGLERSERRAREIELRAGMRRLSRLATQLLSLARIENVGPTTSLLDTGGFATALDLAASLAAAKSVRLEKPAETGAHVSGDERSLELVFTNLLDNALRHTPAGGSIRVTAHIVASSAVVEIVDEGPGLPEAELEKAFERFYRAPGDATEGSGLGLALVRGVVQRLGGTVSLRNRSDRSGLVARVELPRA